MHAQINRVGGVQEVKVVVKEKPDALEGGVRHIEAESTLKIWNSSIVIIQYILDILHTMPLVPFTAVYQYSLTISDHIMFSELTPSHLGVDVWQNFHGNFVYTFISYVLICISNVI